MQLWVGDVERNELHELGETLVEPQVIPPLHRHQVPEPLDRQENMWEQLHVQEQCLKYKCILTSGPVKLH